MNQIRWLKKINPILFILVLWQAMTGLGRDFFGKEVFEKIHVSGGLLLIIFVVIHLMLNWSWVKSNYFRPASRK
jgi:putative Mn2+ efflux pump MntP